MLGRQISSGKTRRLLLVCRHYSDLPDYNTDINVHEHKLKRPVAPPGTVDKAKQEELKKKWQGLEGLKARTRDSLIPDTLKEMETSEEFQMTAKNLRKLGQATLTREEKLKRQRALDELGVPSFNDFWKYKFKEKGMAVKEQTLKKRSIEQFQINIGLYCNQACSHCHVESSPKRSELMDRQTAERCLQVLRNSPSVKILDITGGAPELCPEFRYLAAEGRALEKDVIVRSNLTALLEPGQEDTAQFFADQGLHVIASLPCYSAKNVNLQRGRGVFDRSIQALIMLNEFGYGRPGSGLEMDLVYNPLGAFLPPPQEALEQKYKEELKSLFNIEFNQLFTITNMPIKRFADFLVRRNELHDYIELLIRNYNVDTIDNLMCRNLLSVNWDGKLFDCDFNQQLDIGMSATNGKAEFEKPRVGMSGKGLNVGQKMEFAFDKVENIIGKGYNSVPKTVFDIESCDDVVNKDISVDNHCYGCTAGMGSS